MHGQAFGQSLLGQAKGPAYQRHQPQETVLYQVLLEHWETFRSLLECSGGTLPAHVDQTFEKFLECGILAHGFLRVVCEDCRQDQLVAFSCKKRGFCPSCGGRRMAETAAILVDDVLPHVPYRQWVVSFPFPIRYLLARNPALLSRCLEITYRAISRWYIRQAKKHGYPGGTFKTAGITFIQRFGSKLNLNPHLHMLLADGVFEVIDDQKVRFRKIPSPTDEDIVSLVYKIAKRISRTLKRKGLVLDAEDAQLQAELSSEPEQLDLYPQLQAASIAGISLMDRHGKRAQSQGTLPFLKDLPFSTFGKLCASEQGYSIHAATSVAANDRKKLEKLIRYLARPSLANSRLTFCADQHHVLLEFKKPFRDGATHLKLTPLELIERLAALVPPPRSHLIRYHGAFGPHDAHRALVVLKAKAARKTSLAKNETSNGGSQTQAFPKQRRISWARLLARVFKIDVEVCPNCSGRMRIIAAITERKAIIRILQHLKLPSDLPKPSPARAPPQMTLNDFSDPYDQRTPDTQ